MTGVIEPFPKCKGDDLEDGVSKAACPWPHQGQHVGEAKQGNNDHLLKMRFSSISPCKQICRFQSLQWTECSSFVRFFLKEKIFHQSLGGLVVSSVVVQCSSRSQLRQNDHHDPDQEKCVDHLNVLIT